MTVDSIDLILAAVGLLILLIAEHWWRWTQRDRERRVERLRERGLA